MVFVVQYLKSKVVLGEEATSKPAKLSLKSEKIPKEYMHLKVKGFSCQVKKKDVKEFFAPLKLDSIRLPPKVKGVAYVGFSSERDLNKALNKHRSFHGNAIFSIIFWHFDFYSSCLPYSWPQD